jgi:hypothetical protein
MDSSTSGHFYRTEGVGFGLWTYYKGINISVFLFLGPIKSSGFIFISSHITFKGK